MDPAGKLLYVANENDAMVTVLGDWGRPRHHRSSDATTQADRKIRNSGPAVRGDPAGRHQYHKGRQARLRRSRTRQSGRRGRWRHARGLEIPAGRPAGLARRLHAG
jgi:hypothetical protein